VCPPSRRTEARAGVGPPSTWLDALELLAFDDDQLLECCGRWYLPGRDVNVVRRNLLVVLGNSGRSSDAVRATLARYIEGSDQVLAEHAQWALDQIEGPLLLLGAEVSAPPAVPTPQPNV
jgi:epoxyqueuosine reductase QueG